MRIRDPHKEKAIREQALKMIVREGFEGLSMHKLAKAAGVSASTIYIYFKDRDDLILKLYAEKMGRMSDASLAGFDPAMPFDEGLKVQWINRARHFLKHPLEMHFLEQIRFSPFHDQGLKSLDPRFLESMRAFCKHAIRRGELVKMPVEVYWSVAYAPLYQLVKYHIHGKGLPGTEDFVLDDKLLLQTLKLVLKALKP